MDITLWSDTPCRVWLPGRDSVVRIPAANLKWLEDAATGTLAGINYVVATWPARSTASSCGTTRH